MDPVDRRLLTALRSVLGPLDPDARVELGDGPSLPSWWAVSDLAAASVGAAGGALAAWIGARSGTPPPPVRVDRRLASAWFAFSLRPQGWELPPVWDDLAGDYPTGDGGWIRLHTNAPHHRVAALAALDVAPDRESVARAVAHWSADDLETAVAAAGGASAALRPLDGWRAHPQGVAVAAEPLLSVEATAGPDGGVDGWSGDRARPLAGIRVLDLTRVLAGPVATRLLAGWGADVLRIDPPTWDEPTLAPEVTLGKHCARLDLREGGDRQRFLDLLASADILVHGYRSDALEGLGVGAAVREATRPGLVDVSLDAYGFTGPWRTRRGFDSLVQMSTGIAGVGRASPADRPVPLPVQALDHATGYLLAAAALTGLTRRVADGRGSRWRTSLARMAALLVEVGGPTAPDDGTPWPAAPIEPTGPVETTAWGELRRLAPPLEVEGSPLRWRLPARPLGSDPAVWSG
jgi:hypothetical protein